MELVDNSITPASRPKGAYPAWKRMLRPLASLRLTIVLFVFSLLLVFYGTLAQKEKDIWDVVHEYFWSWVVFVPNSLNRLFINNFVVQAFVETAAETTVSEGTGGIAFPLPGGKLLFWALLINLMSAHLVRFSISWARSGILMIHAGLLMMMAGEFVTREFAEENVMTLVQGGKANFVESTRFHELAFTQQGPDGMVKNVVVPAEMVAAAAGVAEQVLDDPELPFKVKVLQYAENCDLLENFPSDFKNPATEGEGKTLALKPLRKASGVDMDQKVNMPGAYIELLDKKTDKPLGTWLVSGWLQMTRPIRFQEVKGGDGETWKVALRNRRGYRNYTITLKKFTHDVYPGTDKPLNFQSDVLLQDQVLGIERDSVIKMNEPMRHAGETFYQHQALAGDSGSVLQVVRNPGWTLPYLSCIVVSLGMLTHFGVTLLRFMRKQA